MNQITTATTTTVNSTPSQRIDQYQFIRQEAYARVPAFRKTWTASDVILEAIREHGHCPHVTSPKMPVLHYGAPPSDLPRILAELEELSKKAEVPTSKGVRRQRSDTPILIALVASLPYPPSQRSDPQVQMWIEATIKWLRDQYGDAHLISVIEHIDEGFIHLHAYVHNHGRSVKPLMAGHKEVIAAKLSGRGADKPSTVYRAAMVRFQDDYHAAVCAPLGIARKSATPRPRLSRTAYIARRAKELESLEQQATLEKQQIQKDREALANEWAEVATAQGKLAKKREQLAAAWRHFRLTFRTAVSKLRQREHIVASKEEAVAKEELSLNQRWIKFRETCIEVFSTLDAVQKRHFRRSIEELRNRR